MKIKVKKAKRKTLEDLQEDLNKYCTEKLLNYTDSWKSMGEKAVADLVWHGTNILWNLHQRDAIKFCVTMDEIAEEFRCKFGDRYDLHCTCKECKDNPNINTEIKEGKKTSDEFEDDFCEYALVRLQGWGGREEFILEALVHHITHVFWTFDFEDSVLFYLIVDGFMSDFKDETEGQYIEACACCAEKIENGELPEVPKTDGCNGCGGDC